MGKEFSLLLADGDVFLISDAKYHGNLLETSLEKKNLHFIRYVSHVWEM